MKKLFIFILVAFTVGCASVPQSNLPFNKTSIKEGATIGIAVSEIPKSSSLYPGASCLLCLAAAATANSKTAKHIKSLEHDTFSNIKSELKEGFDSQGYKTVILEKPIDFKKLPKGKRNPDIDLADRKFGSFKKDQGIDYLYVLKFYRIGLTRPYRSYAPTGDPAAQVYALAYLVDTQTNTYQWYKKIDVSKYSDTKWKEPPNYPGLTNAFYQALEAAKDQSLSIFKN